LPPLKLSDSLPSLNIAETELDDPSDSSGSESPYEYHEMKVNHEPPVRTAISKLSNRVPKGLINLSAEPMDAGIYSFMAGQMSSIFKTCKVSD
jgi:hypothetical protein